MDGCELQHDDTHAIEGNGRQDDDCQGHAGAVAPGDIREHLTMITSAGEMGKQLRKCQTSGFSKKSEVFGMGE